MIGLELYARLGDTEIVNAARTAAYMAAGLTAAGVRLRGGNTCATIADYVEETWPALVYDDPGDAPPFEGYTLPDDTNWPAPWYDPQAPHSVDFAGLLVEDVNVTAPYSRSTIARAAGGSSLPPLRREGRTITVVGWLIGRTCCSVAYGYRWLNAAIADGVTTVPSTGLEPARSYVRRCATCEHGDLAFFECCPDPDLERCGDGGVDAWPAVDTFLRRMLRVGVVEGVTVLQRKGRNCGCGGCYAMQVQFALHAEDPYIYSEPVGVTMDDGWTGGVEASLIDTETAVMTGGAQTVKTFPSPTNPQAGTLWICTIATRGDVNVPAPTTPSDYELIGSVSSGNTSSDIKIVVFAKYTAGSESVTHTVTLGTAAPATISVLAYADALFDVTDWLAGNVAAVGSFTGDAGDLTAPAIALADSFGPALYIGAIRSTIAGNGTFTPPAGYSELVDVSRGIPTEEVGHEVAELGTVTLGQEIAAATATSSLSGGTRLGAHLTILGQTECVVEWLVTDGTTVTGCECTDTVTALRTPDCATTVVPPTAPVTGQDCYCEGAITVRRCARIDPNQSLVSGDSVLRITITGSTAPTRMVARFYRMGTRAWNADDPDACPTVNECEDFHIVIPSVAEDEVLTIDAMRRQVIKTYVGDDGQVTRQVDAWVGTLDGTPIRWADLCGPMCVCFDLDYASVTDDATGELIDLPDVAVDVIQRQV